MNRNLLNFAIDMAALISGVFCGITGIIKWPGLVYTLGLSYQSLPMDALTWLHDWTGLAVLLLVALHIMMHMGWMITMTKRIARVKVTQDEKT
jgi:hypothetical protein